MSLIEQKSKNIITQITHCLKENSHSHPNDADKIKHKIKVIINTEFSNLAAEEQKNLYKKLSIVLHPDKIQANPLLSSLLKANNISPSEPFQILNEAYKKTNIIDEVANDPLNNIAKLIINLLEQANYHLKLYKRYNEPLRTLVNVASWIINIALAATGLGLFIVTQVSTIIISRLDNIQENLLNFLTQGELRKFIKDYTQEPARYLEAENNFYRKIQDRKIVSFTMALKFNKNQTERDTISSNLDQLKRMSLEDFKKYYIATEAARSGKLEQTVEKETQQTIKEKMYKEQLHGFKKINFFTQFFKHIIFRPLPKSVNSTLFSLAIQRPVIALLAPLVIISTAAISLAKKLNAFFTLSSLVILASIKFASLLVLNSPLYLLDAARYISNKLSTLKVNKSKTTHAPNDGEHLNNDSYTVMFSNGKPVQQSKEIVNQDSTVHAKGGFNLFARKQKTPEYNLFLPLSAPGPNG